jgi:hypothetical protein
VGRVVYKMMQPDLSEILVTSRRIGSCVCVCVCVYVHASWLRADAALFL